MKNKGGSRWRTLLSILGVLLVFVFVAAIAPERGVAAQSLGATPRACIVWGCDECGGCGVLDIPSHVPWLPDPIFATVFNLNGGNVDNCLCAIFFWGTLQYIFNCDGNNYCQCCASILDRCDCTYFPNLLLPDPQKENYTFVGWHIRYCPEWSQDCLIDMCPFCNHYANVTLTSEEVRVLNISDILWWFWGGMFFYEGLPSYFPYRGFRYHEFIAQWQPSTTLNLPCATTNLARDILGSVMTASSEASGRPAIRANNGIREGAATQSWSATGIGQEWLMVDFGQVRNFNHIRIFQGGNRIADYSFEYSNDGVNWTIFHSGTRIMPATPAYYEFTHPTTIQARYVRLVSQRSNGVLPIVVFEFEVYYLPS